MAKRGEECDWGLDLLAAQLGDVGAVAAQLLRVLVVAALVPQLAPLLLVPLRLLVDLQTQRRLALSQLQLLQQRTAQHDVVTSAKAAHALHTMYMYTHQGPSREG